MKHIRQMNVVGKERLASEQARVLVTFDRLAEVACGHSNWNAEVGIRD